MTGEQTSAKEMGAMSRIVGVFTSPRETFESIDRKPTWLVPFLIIVILSMVMQFMVLDIGIKDRLAGMEAQDIPAERYEAAKAQMEGPMRFIGIAMVPIGVLVVWAIVAGIYLFAGNTIMGGESKFKKVFSIVAWSSFIGLVGGILKIFLIMSKGTTRGVDTSLSILMPLPELGQSPSYLYRFLQRFDLFTIWNLVLWVIGFAVIFRFNTKKSATLVLSVWAVYIVLVVVLGGALSSVFGG